MTEITDSPVKYAREKLTPFKTGATTCVGNSGQKRQICTPTGGQKGYRRLIHSSKALKSAFKSPLRKPDEHKPQQESVVDVRAEIEHLKKRNTGIDKEIEDLLQQGFREEELQVHIDKLHEYNEMKDIGQMLLGRIATRKGVTTRDLYKEYGLNLED